jgi:hypothetical protein
MMEGGRQKREEKRTFSNQGTFQIRRREKRSESFT